jgi:hypothetical protein
MLQNILREFGREVPLSINQLSQKLGVEPSALEGMLDFLERKNKLKVVANVNLGKCASCKCSATCIVGDLSGYGKSYVLARE